MKMKAWCHLPTIFKRHCALQLAVLLVLFVALTTTLLFTVPAYAVSGINKTIGFQGRLLRSNGGVVPDGYYNMQFKIYQDGSGNTAGNPDGTLKWTENYVNNGSNAGVKVKNGYFSVDLGSKTAFGSSVDWNQDTLWLSMNIGGSDSSCTTFGSGACSADGEMLPMKRITSAPYALNSGALGGKTADQFLQLAQGVQNDSGIGTTSIRVNKTGSGGNFIQFQDSGSDIFRLDSNGDIELGNNNDHVLFVKNANTDNDGNSLIVRSGNGGSGTGSTGGALAIQGGDAGGTNGDGGNLAIDAGGAHGSGSDGKITIGTTHASDIVIGSTHLGISQNIYVGDNGTSGNNTNVYVGNGADSASGETIIQAKNSVSIKANGVTKATFSDSTSAVYFGNGVYATAPDNFTIQGTSSYTDGVAGATLSVQGGNAIAGNSDGGNLVLSGGSANGSGSDGLVVLSTPTFSTVTNDSNCYASGALVATSCTLASSTINRSAAAIVGFSTTEKTATIPDPTRQTAGRIFYLMAAKTSQTFTLSLNGGANTILVRSNTTVTLVWNGDDWTSASGSTSTSLQEAYNNTPQAVGSTELVVSNSANANGLTVKNNSTAPVSGSILDVKSSSDSSLFSVRTNTTRSEFASDGNVNTAGTFATNWQAVGSASVSRITTDGKESSDSAQVVAGTNALNGIRNKLTTNLGVNNAYRISVYAKLTSGSSFSDFKVMYSPNDGASFVDCTNYNTQAITSTGWGLVTCDVASGSTPASASYVYFVQTGSAAQSRTFLLDSFSMTRVKGGSNFVEIGNKNSNDETLLVLDRLGTAPEDNDVALEGSMYYNTALGKVQCYESTGWGECGTKPDTFVTLSPQYSNAVMNGADVGTISSDLCSDLLNINDGSSGQASVCGTNETQNFYKWTSTVVTPQTRGIYITYQLPSTFKQFVSGSTKLMAKTDSTNATVNYQVYRDYSGGLTACGSATTASTGAKTTWQTVAASGSADPANCSFSAGDSILIRINLTAQNTTNAYVSDLSFAFSNND